MKNAKRILPVKPDVEKHTTDAQTAERIIVLFLPVVGSLLLRRIDMARLMSQCVRTRPNSKCIFDRRDSTDDEPELS